MSDETDRLYWRVTTAAYVAANRDKVNAARRARYARCRNRILEQQRGYREIHGERWNAKRRVSHRAEAD